MIYICADDYGISAKTCRQINECAACGAVNKISVLPNTEVKDIQQYIPKQGVMLGAHINLVEGRPLSPPESVRMLLDKRGCFKYSFPGLFLRTLLPGRKKFTKQIYTEIKSQLAAYKQLDSDSTTAIDSHQHTHMIPAVFKALMRAVRDEGIQVRYLRMPAEPIWPYLRQPGLYITYRPINLVKQGLLKLLGRLHRAKLQQSGIQTAIFMGVLFSGHMDAARVKKVLPHYIRLAEKKGMDIELLFHPGHTESGDAVMDDKKKGFNRFYAAGGRKTEYNTLQALDISF